MKSKLNNPVKFNSVDLLFISICMYIDFDLQFVTEIQ